MSSKAKPDFKDDFNVVETSQVVTPPPVAAPIRSDMPPAPTAPRPFPGEVSTTPAYPSAESSAKLVPPSYATDYRTLTGQVQSWRGSWRLRYSDIGVEDQYGGSVTLDGVREQLQEGCQVRVQGQLLPAADRLSTPRFQVQALEVLSK